jgi:outer membrane protein assembly factor BamA
MLLGVPALCYAQSPADGQQAQPLPHEQVVALPPSESGRIERILNTLERHGLLPGVVPPPDGFSLRVGGIDSGAELALGPRWQHSRLAGGRLQVQASAAMSRRDREVELGAALPRLASGRLRVGAAATATELAEESFYGLGNQSPESHLNVFAMGRRSLGATVTFMPSRMLSFEAGSGLLLTRLHDLAGLEVVGADFHYLHSRAAATLDYRDQPGNPRSGGRYHVAVHRFAGSRDEWSSFSRVDAELEHHFSASEKQGLLTLRVIASFSEPDEGHDLPFYLQPTLGGSRLLRGFASDRFRDRQHAVLQAEYGRDLSPFLNAVLFYERGMVAPRISDLKWSSMHSDYGVGLRIGTARSVAMRTDVAFSGEGTRFTVRFDRAF